MLTNTPYILHPTSYILHPTSYIFLAAGDLVAWLTSTSYTLTGALSAAAISARPFVGIRSSPCLRPE